MYEGCHSDVLVCLSSPPPLNCRQRTLGRLPEVWGRWNRGVNLNLGPITLLSDFPSRSGIYWAQLFICLFAFAFADCHSIECICFSAAAMSQGLCWIHFPLVSTTPYTHVYTYILFCLPKMTNRRCARTSPPPMRNKDQRLHFEWLSNTELLQLVFMSCLNNWSQP